MSQGFDYAPNIKIVLLGESTVGKTSIVNVVHGGEFVPEQTATIGACFHIKVMRVGDVSIKLHIWDTAGQERFRSLAPMYYRDAQFAVLVYAVNNRDSFQTIETWYRGLVDDCLSMPHVLLVGNKIDLVDERKVQREEGEELAAKLNAKFFEVSAKEDQSSIKTMLEVIAEDAVKEFGNTTGAPEVPTKVVPTKTAKKSCGC